MRKADNLITYIMCGVSRTSGSLGLLKPLGPVQACDGIALISINVSLFRNVIVVYSMISHLPQTDTS